MRLAKSGGALILLLLAGCGDGGPAGGAGWSGTIDTLQSGRLVIRNPDAALWRDGEAWTLRERFRVGALQGDGPDVLGEIRDVELGAAGEVYILDSQASEVRVFGPDGQHLLTFGREGEGPGELNRPAGMALDSERTLWVMNWGNARYSGFDPATGEIENEMQRLAGYAMIPWPGRFDASDRLLDVGLGSDGEPVILRLDSAFVPQDTLPVPRADDEHQVNFVRDGVRIMSATIPFAPQPSWAPHPDEGIIVGEGAAYRLHRIGFSGDTTVTIEVSREPVPVRGAERDSALALFEELTRDAGGQPDRRPRIPDHRPAHGALFVDDQGRIWVRRQQPSGRAAAWDVIAEDGRLLGWIEVSVEPTYMSPTVRGDRLALATQIDGVPTVIVYDIVRTTAADP